MFIVSFLFCIALFANQKFSQKNILLSTIERVCESTVTRNALVTIATEKHWCGVFFARIEKKQFQPIVGRYDSLILFECTASISPMPIAHGISFSRGNFYFFNLLVRTILSTIIQMRKNRNAIFKGCRIVSCVRNWKVKWYIRNRPKWRIFNPMF